MKIALLNDTHFGVKNASDIFLNYQSRFFEEIFFPYCVKHNIKQIIHLGDFYDQRKYVGIKTLQRSREFFLSKLNEYGMTMDIIPGNHDVFFKNTNDVSSLFEILPHYSNVSVFMQPTVKEYDGMKIALLPWMTNDNMGDSLSFIANSKSDVLCAHLELNGFEMMKGAPAMSHGLSADLFKQYEMVLSGHYHTKSTKGNIYYLGTQYELTWADCNDPKYFHILDTKDRTLNQIRNPITIFNKIIYTERGMKTIDFSKFKDTYVKIIVASKSDIKKFDAFVDAVQRSSPFDLKIVETFDEFTGSSVDDENISILDTSDLLNSYVDAIETNLDKDRIKKVLQELYVEAQQTDML